MSRKKNAIPTYRLHKSSGNAVVTVYGSSGRRHDVYLGRYQSAESKREYARIVAELANSPAAAAALLAPADLTVAELIAAYWKHVTAACSAAQCNGLSKALKHVRRLYDHSPAHAFGPVALRTVRAEMVGDGWSRGVVNNRVNAIKAMFRWAASEELLAVGVYDTLRTVAALARGKTTAPDYPPVTSVSDDDVAATLPHCPPAVAAMLKILRLTGCRPGELCILRPIDLDTSGAVWTFKPSAHKTASRGKSRTVYFGPRAQLVLKPFLSDCPADGYVFSPIRERTRRHAELRKRRKSAVPPSQQAGRAKPQPALMPGERYTPASLGNAVRAAADKAGAPRWFPYQLRHSFASEARRVADLDAARILLGHTTGDQTAVYAEQDHGKAVEVAKRIG